MKRIEEIQQKATEAGDARFRRSERERMAYVLGRIHGGQWADKTMLDKVCEWLKCNLPYSSKPPYQVIEDLRKAMKEE